MVLAHVGDRRDLGEGNIGMQILVNEFDAAPKLSPAQAVPSWRHRGLVGVLHHDMRSQSGTEGFGIDARGGPIGKQLGIESGSELVDQRIVNRELRQNFETLKLDLGRRDLRYLYRIDKNRCDFAGSVDFAATRYSRRCDGN